MTNSVPDTFNRWIEQPTSAHDARETFHRKREHELFSEIDALRCERDALYADVERLVEALRVRS